MTRRHLLCVFGLVAGVVLVAGCGRGGSASPVSDDPQGSATVVTSTAVAPSGVTGLPTIARAELSPRGAGRTWGALVDCLHDLSWLPQESRLVVWEHAEVLGAKGLGAFTVAVDVLHGAVRRWAGTPAPLAVLLVGVDQTSVDAGTAL